jgi:hypothetical protein
MPSLARQEVASPFLGHNAETGRVAARPSLGSPMIGNNGETVGAARRFPCQAPIEKRQATGQFVHAPWPLQPMYSLAKA